MDQSFWNLGTRGRSNRGSNSAKAAVASPAVGGVAYYGTRLALLHQAAGSSLLQSLYGRHTQPGISSAEANTMKADLHVGGLLQHADEVPG
jgi:hypothetical protein